MTDLGKGKIVKAVTTGAHECEKPELIDVAQAGLTPGSQWQCDFCQRTWTLNDEWLWIAPAWPTTFDKLFAE